MRGKIFHTGGIHTFGVVTAISLDRILQSDNQNHYAGNNGDVDKMCSISRKIRRKIETGN